jgi:hypothetical protein
VLVLNVLRIILFDLFMIEIQDIDSTISSRRCMGQDFQRMSVTVLVCPNNQP